MVSAADLRGILLIQDLPEAMLEKMAEWSERLDLQEREVLFEEGQKAEKFYMLKRGKVLLEVEISPTIIISLGAIKAGYSFGWSALLADAAYTSYAVTVEHCEVLALTGKRFLDIIQEDYAVGYGVMEKAFQIIKRRLERRTGQFLKVMSKHPGIQTLLGATE
jgi:CRP/FNR family cyclic AMP-dependent transcriptional regulator